MIHHYTSIRALRCIVESKQLRFTRLDKFDDVLEGQSHSGIEFGTQFFGSCWVREEAEDIPQWRMYGDGMKGVRISLPDNPFNQHLLNEIFPVPGTSASWEFNGVLAPYPMRQVIGDGYILFPTAFVEDAGAFLRDVVYVPDIEAVYRKRVTNNDGVVTIQGRPCDLAYFKSDRWSFQKECRFVLQAFKGVQGGLGNKRFGEEFIELAKTGSFLRSGPDCEHLFLDLNEVALSKLVVTMGPLSSEEDLAEVRGLLAGNAPQALVVRSALSGLVR